MGRTIERGLTNRLYGGEIADIMERFDQALFQIQVWRDLAVARYKLYDAVGMWLQSQTYVTPATYEEIKLAARDYLNQTLVPAYFQRLHNDPFGKALPLNIKQANYVTRGFSQLPEELQLKAVAEFSRASLKKEDWFYSLLDKKVFAAENETGGYTLMLAEEY